MCWRFPCFILSLDAFGQLPWRSCHQHKVKHWSVGDGKSEERRGGECRRTAVDQAVARGCFLTRLQSHWYTALMTDASAGQMHRCGGSIWLLQSGVTLTRIPMSSPTCHLVPPLLFCSHVTVTFRDRRASTIPCLPVHAHEKTGTHTIIKPHSPRQNWLNVESLWPRTTIELFSKLRPHCQIRIRPGSGFFTKITLSKKHPLWVRAQRQRRRLILCMSTARTLCLHLPEER